MSACNKAQEINVVKYWLNAEEILAPGLCAWLLRHLPRLWDV